MAWTTLDQEFVDMDMLVWVIVFPVSVLSRSVLFPLLIILSHHIEVQTPSDRLIKNRGFSGQTLWKKEDTGAKSNGKRECCKVTHCSSGWPEDKWRGQGLGFSVRLRAWCG